MHSQYILPFDFTGSGNDALTSTATSEEEKSKYFETGIAIVTKLRLEPGSENVKYAAKQWQHLVM